MDQCIFKPPLTKVLFDEDLMNIVQQPFSVDISCHSQGVEPCVRMVTDALNAVHGIDARDYGYTREIIKSRIFMPSSDKKHEFEHLLMTRITANIHKQSSSALILFCLS